MGSGNDVRVSQKARRGVDQGGSKKVLLFFWLVGRTGPSGLAGAAVLPLASGGTSAKMRTAGLGVLHLSLPASQEACTPVD